MFLIRIYVSKIYFTKIYFTHYYTQAVVVQRNCTVGSIPLEEMNYFHFLAYSNNIKRDVEFQHLTNSRKLRLTRCTRDTGEDTKIIYLPYLFLNN